MWFRDGARNNPLRKTLIYFGILQVWVNVSHESIRLLMHMNREKSDDREEEE